MATASGTSILARARVLASQTRTDANSSPVIDAMGGLRVALNNSVRQVFRNHANDQKFVRDIFSTNAVTMVSGVGACPDEVMREFLHLGEFADDDNSLITYYNYLSDYQSGQNFSQLGYVVLVGDDFNYTPPNGTATSYSGTLNAYTPCFPTFPADLADPITFPSTTIIDDTVVSLAAAIVGQLEYTELGIGGSNAK